MVDSIHFGKGFPENLKNNFTSSGDERLEFYDDNLEKNKEFVGYVNLRAFEQPVPFYYVSYVKKNRNHYREQFDDKITTGDLLVQRVNEFLKAKNLPGLLLCDESKHEEFYKKNGWLKVPDSKQGDYIFMAFNLSPEQAHDNFFLHSLVDEVHKYEQEILNGD